MQNSVNKVAETKVIEPVNVDCQNGYNSVVFLPKLNPNTSSKGFSPKAIKYFPQASVEPKHKSPDPIARLRTKQFYNRQDNRLKSVYNVNLRTNRLARGILNKIEVVSNMHNSANDDDVIMENEIKSDNESKNSFDNKSLQELLQEVVPDNLI